MNIEVSVKNEDEILAEVRKFLRQEARRRVADCPQRIGKRFAQVEFPPVNVMFGRRLPAVQINFV